MSRRKAVSVTLFAVLGGFLSQAFCDEHTLRTFTRQRLTDVYYSEGIASGDLNNDGHQDVVYGPHWYAGPDFRKSHEIYQPVAQNREGYANHFFHWVRDFNGDGAQDILVAGFPGTPGYVYENPGANRPDQPWVKHEILDWVSNESPQFVHLVGDERPELVCTREGFFGYATVDWEQPWKPWKFTPISDKIAPERFGHGLGVGDINGDGRADILFAQGWLEQPESLSAIRWKLHKTSFSQSYGGAEMFAYDVDGDGDNDVITSEAAHDFGLSWYEQQTGQGGKRSFKQHVIMGDHPALNRYGVLFSELHSVRLADMDGDGLQDIVTGKTYYSHHRQSPMWDAGAVVYWFRLQRSAAGVNWVPYRADTEAGIGRQVNVTDINQDGLPDILSGGMKGAHILVQKRSTVDETTWRKAQPQEYHGRPAPSADNAQLVRGAESPIDAATGAVAGALEAEELKAIVTTGHARGQPMSGFTADHWSGKSQLWWTGARPGDSLRLQLPAAEGNANLEIVLSCAPDYGIVQLSLDGQPLGPPIDLYHPEVVTTGVLTFDDVHLKPGKHELRIQIVGANAAAAKSYMVGVDYVRIRTEESVFLPPDNEVLATDDQGHPLNLDFESGTLQDWTASGNAFEGQPIKGETSRGSG